MNQDDQRFFRQNFSADSFSDADDDKVPQATYEKRPLKFKIPSLSQKESINIMRRFKQSVDGGDRREDSRNSITDSKRTNSFIDNNQKNQLSILQKFKAQIQGIKHINSYSRGDQQDGSSNSHNYSADQPKSLSLNQKSHSIKVESTNNNLLNHLNKKRQSVKAQQTIQRQSSKNYEKQYSELVQARKLEALRYKQQQEQFLKKDDQKKQVIQQKDILIRQFAKNEEQRQQSHFNQVRQLQNQVQKLIDTINSIRKQLLDKEYEITQAKQKYRRSASDPKTMRLEHENELLKRKENQYLQTIKQLQTNAASKLNYSFASSSINKQSSAITSQIIKLRQLIDERDKQWNQRITEKLQNQRVINTESISQMFNSCSNLVQQSVGFSNYQLNNQLPETFDRLIKQIQQLKKSTLNNPPPTLFGVQQELQSIKQFIFNAQKTGQYVSIVTQNLTNTDDMIVMLKQQLDEYKRYILEEQNNKKIFLEQLNLYKEQNQDIIKQNGYLRHQLGTMQHNLNRPNNNSQGASEQNLDNKDQHNQLVQDLRKSISNREIKIQEQGQYIRELQQKIVNEKPLQPIILHQPTGAGTEGDIAELHLEIERLNSLFETQIAQLTSINQQKIRSYQKRISLYEQRISMYELTSQNQTIQLQEHENQIRLLSSKSQADLNFNNLQQFNNKMQQQVNMLRTQLGSLTGANRQLQRQVKERSYAVDHLWQVKQAEFENVKSIVNKIKISSQF